MNDAIPFYEDGDELTCTATAAVTGKRFVRITGNRQADGTISVGPCGAGQKPLGVAMFDAGVGKRVTVHSIDSHHCMPVTASGAIAAGDSVASGAAGVAVVAGGAPGTVVHCAGIAVNGAADGADAQVSLSRHSTTV